MDARQLQILRELGERGSVGAVAEALYVTPSAISQQLRLLQRSIPVALTEKAGRRLVLTDAGRALAVAAAEVDLALARAQRAVDAFVEGPGGPVRVAGFHSAAASFFPALLEKFSASGPPLEFGDEDVAQADFPALTGDYDVVLAHRLDHTTPWPASVTAKPLLHEPLDVALPEGHPLAAKDHLLPADVAGERWITVREGFPLLATIDAIGAAAGRQLEIAHRINDFRVAAAIVAADGGVALIPRWTSGSLEGVVLKPLRGVRARRHVDALHRPERAIRHSVKQVLAELRRTAKQIQAAAL
jgi:DNA-binding transcriptional LysR family regulator